MMKQSEDIKPHIYEALKANREVILAIMAHSNKYMHTSDMLEISSITDTITRELGIVLDMIEQREAIRKNGITDSD